MQATWTLPDGTAITATVPEGHTLMQAAVVAGVPHVIGECGGNLSCATCHVQVEKLAFSRLPSMSEDENYLLEISAHRCPTSRLSCQLVVEAHMAGLNVRIAPEDV